MVNKPTHYKGNILDLIITNNEDVMHDLRIYPSDYRPISTGNSVISFCVKSQTNHLPSSTTQVAFDYSKANYHDLHGY